MIDVGTVLAGRYELRERLGAGGMGEVYRAFDSQLEREVAIKSLLPHLAGEEALVLRFQREARALARVRHPGIIALFDLLNLGREGLYLVLELVPGRSLEQELHRGPLSWSRCADIGTQVCGALAAAHAQDVVHRDIKPSNILIEPSGVARVADFGIARLAGASLMTRAGVSMGTPGFWAPEQALGEASSPQTDIYSLGAVLFIAATGRPPFEVDEDGPAAAFVNVTRPVPDPRTVAPGLPDAAAEVIMTAMAKDPAERFSSTLEMAHALRRSAGLPAVPVTPLETVVPPSLAEGPDAPVPSEPPARALPPESTVVEPVPMPQAVPEPKRQAGGPPETEISSPEAAGPDEVPAVRPSPVQTAPPAADSAGKRRGRTPALVAAGVALVAAAGLVGFAISGSPGGEATADPRLGQPVGAGLGTVRLPEAWEVRTGAQLPGAALEAGRTAVSASQPDAFIAVGRSRATGPTLLPPGLVERLEGPAGTPDRVRLGPNAAYRFPALAVDGAPGPVTAFVIPTRQGVQTIACSAPSAAFATFAPTCEAAAASMRLSGVSAIPLGPSPAYGRALDAAIGRLNAEVPALRRALAGAERPEDQAEAATGLAAIYSAARGDLVGQQLGPEGAGLNEAVVAALGDASSAHEALASAASAGDAMAFAEARAAVAAAHRRLRAALGDLAERGYSFTAS